MEWLKTLTPPEWGAWHLLAKLAYVVVFVGLMIPVIIFAHWFSDWLFPNW